MDNSKYWVWITQAFGPGNPLIWEIMSAFESVEQAYFSLIDKVYTKLTDAEAQAVSRTHLYQAEKVIEYCEGKGISVITYEDKGYPNRLRGIFNPPTVLFCMGSLDYVDDDIAVTVVGTRHPSDYSIKVAKKICRDLSNVGVTLVSGFALGIDSMAHQAALKNNSRTIAVLGCGIDYDYPKENSAIKEVIARRGAVISEFFPGTRPDGRNFPQRNRILSGLSLGTLVVEADNKSGSLITADLALQQGRDVFCIPPADLFDSRYSGVVRLIRDGAVSTFSYLDIIYEYYENFSHKLNSINPYGTYSDKLEDSVLFENEYKDESNLKNKDISSVPSVKAAEIKTEPDCTGLNECQIQVVKALSENGAMSADELAVATGISVTDLLTILTELELFGKITALAGRRYAL